MIFIVIQTTKINQVKHKTVALKDNIQSANDTINLNRLHPENDKMFLADMGTEFVSSLENYQRKS